MTTPAICLLFFLAGIGVHTVVHHLARIARAWWNDPARAYRRQVSTLRKAKRLPR